ncbi:MAG: hypothetical protein JXA92_08735 [candidate division Zixibacteria bacterium]|nr:hypothetical protein [candidate division Zixibacteria bacterium]
MRSWSYFIWVKRLIPLLVIGGAILGYNYYDKITEAKRLLQDEQKALITAKVWVASAVYRENPDRFKTYRDSLLKIYNISESEMTDFLKAYGDKTEHFNNFTWLVQQFVDSLTELDYPQSDTLGDSVKSP